MPLPTPSAPFEPPQAPRRVLRSDPWIPAGLWPQPTDAGTEKSKINVPPGSELGRMSRRAARAFRLTCLVKKEDACCRRSGSAGGLQQAFAIY